MEGRQPWEKPPHSPLPDAFTGTESSGEHKREKEPAVAAVGCQIPFTSLQQREKSPRASPIPVPGTGEQGKLTRTGPSPLPKEASTSLA